MRNPRPELKVMEYELNAGAIPTRLCRMYQRDGSELWAIRRGSMTLNRYGEWEWEPIPSERTDEYIRANRYLASAEAVGVWRQLPNETQPRAAQEEPAP